MATKRQFSFIAWCAASGICGALSATCGKEAPLTALTASPYSAALMYAAMLAFNFLGLTLFSIALRHTASLQATAASVSANILASGILGWAVYSETLNKKWWLGVACLTFGTVLVQPRTKSLAEKKEEEYREEREEDVLREYNLPYKYIAEVAYDGTRYNGFQLQKTSSASTSIKATPLPLAEDGSKDRSKDGSKSNQKSKAKCITIQGKLENALTQFLGISREALLLQGAGRTDAGVHARGQVIHFFSKRLLNLDTNRSRAILALNSLLPEDIHVLRLQRVPLDYNVRFSMGKIYVYDLHLDPLGSDPFTQRYRLCPRALLNSNFNLEALSSAASAFVGTYDFSLFSSKPRDRGQRTAVRTIKRCEVVQAPPHDFLTATPPTFSGDPLLRIEIEGDGFLYKQVRHMVGAMLAVAAGRITAEDISMVLNDADHEKTRRSGATLFRPGAYVLAEPQGLCLQRVLLPDPGNPEELMYGEQGPVLKRKHELVDYFSIDK